MMRRLSAAILALLILTALLTACSTELKVPDVSLMEYPGLKWNSSVKEVKKALNLEKTKILADEQAEYLQNSEYEIWHLVVTGIQLFGFEVEQANFEFIRYPGHDYGLMRIELEYPSKAYINTIKDNMIEIYNEGCSEAIQSYYFNPQGELVAHDMNSMASAPYAEEGFPHYWYSTAKGTEVLSAAAQERYVAHYMNNNPVLTRNALLEYLEKTPVVQVT